MLSIGKLAPAQERYYLDAVARGREDYYLHSGEAPGRWLGAGAPDLDLAGEVGEADLVAVLAGEDPRSGEKLAQAARARDRVAGFDLTFSAPKSVSLLHALTEQGVSHEVRDAHDAAVGEALAYLERETALARRRDGGTITWQQTSGFVAAAFRHRTSRAMDPALHTHVLVANLVRGGDARWGAFDAKLLYRHAKTAGFLYKAHLRHELTRRLGVEWGPIVRGTAEVQGVPAHVIRSFSTRRQEIEARLAERGLHSHRAAETAALDTRPAKDPSVDTSRVADEWRAKAATLGLGAPEIAGLLHRARHLDSPRDELARIASEIAGPGGVTRDTSTFVRRRAVEAWCEALPRGATVAAIEALTDQFLTVDSVVSLQDAAKMPGRAEARYTTREMLATERSLVESATDRARSGVGLATPDTVEQALTSRPTLRAEQRAAVERLTRSGAGVEVLIGKAGSGKTFALAAAREAWEAEGHRVVGCATAARAAAVLTEESGIESHTIASLLNTLSQADGLPPRSVLVVDEAGMVGTRTLARLADHARAADAKLVLVGDPRQLPEIEAGGALKGIAARLGAIELVENHRQHAIWERDALDDLRDGDVTAAVTTYDARGRIITAATAGELRERLVEDWWSTRQAGETAIMIASRHVDVDDLNRRARERRRQHGELHGPTLTVGPREFALGDDVIATRNSRRLGVLNGTRGVVVGIEPEDGSLSIETDRGRLAVLEREYLDAGHLTHGYATTAHKAQGMTTERSLVFADDTVYREWAYVGLSRGRLDNRVYLAIDEPPSRQGATGRLAADLARSRGKDLALDSMGRALDVR